MVHELDDGDSPARRPRTGDAVPQRASEDEESVSSDPNDPATALEESATFTVMDERHHARPALQRASEMARIHLGLCASEEGRVDGGAPAPAEQAPDDDGTASHSSGLRSEDDPVRIARFQRFRQTSRSVDHPLWINQELMRCRETDLAPLVESVRFGFDRDNRGDVDASGVVLNDSILSCFEGSLRRYAERQMAAPSDTQSIGMYMPSEEEMQQHEEQAQDLQSYTRHTHDYDTFDAAHKDRLTFPFDNDEHLINMAYGPCVVDVHMASAADDRQESPSTVYVQVDQRKVMGFVVSDLRARTASDRGRLRAWSHEHPDLNTTVRDQCDTRLKHIEELLQGSLLPMHAIDHRWAPENRTYCGEGGVTMGNICSATARTRQDKWSTRAECNNMAGLYIESQYLQAKHVFELTARERALGSVLDFARAPGKDATASTLDTYTSQPCKRTQGFTNCLDMYRQEAQVCLRRARHLQLRYAAIELNEYPAATAALVNSQIVCSALRQRLLVQKAHLEDMQESIAADKLRLSTLGDQLEHDAKRLKNVAVGIVDKARQRNLLGELPIGCQELETCSDAQLPHVVAFLRKHFSERVAHGYEALRARKNAMHDKWWALHNQCADKNVVLRKMAMSYYFLRGRRAFEVSRLSVATNRVCLMLAVMPKIKNLIHCMTQDCASITNDGRAHTLWLYTFADMITRMCIPGFINMSDREIDAAIALSNRATGVGCKHNVRAIVSGHLTSILGDVDDEAGRGGASDSSEAAPTSPEGSARGPEQSSADASQDDGALPVLSDYDDIMREISQPTSSETRDAVPSVAADDNSDGASWGSPSFPVQICARTLQLFLKDASHARGFVDVARRRLELCRAELALANIDLASNENAAYRTRVLSMCRSDVITAVTRAIARDSGTFYTPTDDMIEDHGGGHPFGNPAVADAENVKLGVAIEEDLQVKASLLRDLYYDTS